MKRFLPGLPLLLSVANVLAQTATPDDAATATVTPSAADAATGVAALLAGGVCTLVPCLGSIALWLFLAIWIMKDAQRRQSPNATLVTVLGWIPVTTVIGLIVHLVTRPKTIPGETNLPPTV